MAVEQLIIFVKNPIPGTVKTRIARTVGNDKAAEVYRHLIAYTQSLTRMLPWHRTVYYADFVNPNDGWNSYEKQLQQGTDLGERMLNAFRERFKAGAQRVLIIGSDCLDLRAEHLKKAFRALDSADVVIGPTSDGGYYLLGMKQLHPFLFENKPWSQPDLLNLTLKDLQQKGVPYALLEELTDIDEWEDYLRYI
ncbi:TIGR04282 family arsenosugar biosynthesis glycosyltransferase [Nibrella saemangeumensis]|uniref:TIGR04282 family arsenosugar biosynthesis glycosyltransferase n=1 Tax=Nibrella saemangeumensis TaxID=1084526 RepID=A0ABP8MQT5_9BACT